MFYEESEKIYDDLMFLKQRLIEVGRSGSSNEIMSKKEIKYFSNFFKSESARLRYQIPEIFKYNRTSGEIFRFLQDTGGYADRDAYISQFINPLLDIYDDDGYLRDEKSNVNLKENMISDNGSYAQVFKFKDPITGRFLAYKSLRNNLTDKETKRFYHEYNVMSDLNSNNIVKVYRQTEDGYIMELCDYTLDEYMRIKNNKLKPIDRKRLLIQVFRVINYIHTKDMLHRDLSYRNFLIKEYEDYPIIKIADFGLVKTLESKMTSLNTELKGSLADPWLSLNGFANYGVKNEIYSLGYIINKIITGKDNIRLNDIKNDKYKNFIIQCINSQIDKRFNSVLDVAKACFDDFFDFF